MRTFLAVEVSDAIRSQARKLTSQLARDAAGVTRTRRGRLHL